MSLPWAARGLKIPYVDRNDQQSRSLAMAAALSHYQAGDQGDFPGAAAGEFRVQHRMTADLHQCRHP
ncbi:hypothetical protein ABZ890_45930, partial [Streptomyces sp. NPDC046984]|uniref:hypothetical protein n=1 Tax=Streptomyces sp. NPDC046984 TaxID=3155138 RepID=UPI0033EFE3F7